MRSLLRLLFVVLALVAGVLVWLADPDGAGVVEPAVGLARQTLETGTSLERVNPEAATSATRLSAGLADEPAIVAPAASEKPDSVALSGTWTVIDEQGLRRDSEDGRFRIEFWEPQDEERWIEVDAGGWETDVHPDSVFVLADLELGGLRAVPAEATFDLRVPTDGQLNFDARWVRDSVLMVVDRDTRVELNDLEVVGDHPVSDLGSHPAPYGADHVLLQGVASPVQLPAPEKISHWGAREPLWVRAPGYAWGQIKIPRATGGEFVLPLGPGGNLLVTLEGVPEGAEAWLRLREPPGDDPADYESVRFEMELGDRRRVKLSSVEVGHYRVSLEARHRYREPTTLVAELVEVSAGKSTEVNLVARANLVPAVAGMSGRLIVHPDWKQRGFDLQFSRVGGAPGIRAGTRLLDLSQMQSIDSELGVWAWSLEELEVGSWELRCNPHGTSLAVELGPAGREDVVLEVPQPALVLVHVRDARSGEPVEDARVNWMPNREGLTSPGVMNGAGRLGPGEFQLRAPAGRVDLSCNSTTHRYQLRTIDVAPGESEWTIETTPSCGLVISWRDGTTTLQPDGLEATVTNTTDEGESWYVGDDALGLAKRYVCTEPGRYRVQVPVPEGYAPLEPFEVDVPDGVWIERVLDVRRLR